MPHPRRSERDPSFNEWSLGSKKEEVNFIVREKEEKRREGSEAPYREANIRKSSECRNDYAAHMYAFLKQG